MKPRRIKMKAFRWYGKREKLKLEEIPIPTVGEKDVLIEIRAAGVCGSDLHFIHGDIPLPTKLPVTPGHEMAGIVVETGKSVTDLKKGDRVSVNYMVSCGDCEYCNQGADNLCTKVGSLCHTFDGGFAEYVLVPERNAFPLPEQIPMDQGSIIGCAVTTPLHALKGPGSMQIGDTVAVFGLGGVGMHAIQWAAILGARKVIGVDVMDYKLKLAKSFGADITINSMNKDPVKLIKEVTNGYGVDLALDCVALKETLFQTLQSVRTRGRAVWVGQNWYKDITFPLPDFKNILLLNEIIFTGSKDHTRNDQKFALDYVASGKYDLSKSITHTLPFEKLNEALAILEEKRGNPLRVVITR
jgi:propanol-preferring alcohol dehydrogenase